MLRSRQAPESIEERSTQLVKRSKRQFHLGLDTRGAHEPAPGSAAVQVVEECSLADPGLAANHEHPARPGPRIGGEPIEGAGL
jgi:hypothetical protein